MDEAGARVHLSNIKVPKEIVTLEEKIEAVREEKNQVVKSQKFEEAARLRDSEKKLAEELDNAKEEWERQAETQVHDVTDIDIAQVVGMMTGIPVDKISAPEGKKLMEMDTALQGSVVGQTEAIQKLSPRHPPHPRRPQRPEAPHRLVHLSRPHGRRQDGARQAPHAVPVRQPGRAHPHRHVGVHGEVLRVPPRRRASRLRRLRRGRAAHRKGPPQAVLRRAAGRDREGAPGRVQHPPPGAGRRHPHRRPRPPGGLPQHDHHHDLEHRGARHQEPRQRHRLLDERGGVRLQAHEVDGGGRAEAGLQPRVPEPHRRRDRVPPAGEERTSSRSSTS